MRFVATPLATDASPSPIPRIADPFLRNPPKPFPQFTFCSRSQDSRSWFHSFPSPHSASCSRPKKSQ